MEDEHRYNPTPTRDQHLLRTLDQSTRHCLSPPATAVANLSPSPLTAINPHLTRGNKKFINTRNFSTLTTKLSSNYGDPACEQHETPSHQEFQRDLSNSASDSGGSGVINPSPISDTQRVFEKRTNNQGDKSPAYVRSVSESPINKTHGPPALVPGVSTSNSHSQHSSASSSGHAHRIHRPLSASVGHGRHNMGSLRMNDSPIFAFSDSQGFQMTLPVTHDKHGNDQSSSNRRAAELNTPDYSLPTGQQSTGDRTAHNRMDQNGCGQFMDSGQHWDQVHASSDMSDPTGNPSGHSVSDTATLQQPAETTNSLMTTSDHDKSTNPPTEDFEFQKPLPYSSPTKHNLPPFRRQLSKRKSEIFGVPTHEVDKDSDDEDDDDDDDFYSVGSSIGRRSDPCTPTSPKARRLENYDPYQIFEVQHTPCLILTVRVLRGRNITMGFQDLYDTPDPYINLVMRSSPEGRKSTTVKENNTNPVWNEEFTFFINFTQANVLEITLMESNLLFDQKVGTVYFDIVEILEMEKPQLETFVFNEVSQIDIEFTLEFDRNPTLRYSLCLSEQEKAFIERRKEKAFQGMRKLLGEEDAPWNKDEVPTIAVIGSGGGFRAMTGYSGVFKALIESGILDCTTYAGGLSGSSWLLSTLYSHPKWPNLDMGEFVDELKHRADKSLLRFLNVSTMYNYAKFMIQKRKGGQPVSFTDIFGRMVGETLLSDRMETTLTDQREKLKDGAVPMPLYTCVHVKKDVPARSFQEWVEFSPYEIGMPKYGTFMDSKLFGSKFFMGKLVKEFKEQPLHFLQGIWGSAFCILFKRLMEDNRRIDPVEMVRQEMNQQLEEARNESSSDCSEDEVDDTSSPEGSSFDSDVGSVSSVKNGGDDDSNNDSFDTSMDKDSDTMQAEEDEYKPKRSVSSRKASVFKAFSSSSEEMTAGDEEMERRNSADSDIQENAKTDRRKNSNAYSTDGEIDDDTGDGDSAYVGEEDGYEDEDENDDEEEGPAFRSIIKRGSVEMKQAKRPVRQSSKDSASPDNDMMADQLEASYASVASVQSSQGANALSASRKSVNWGACPTRGHTSEGQDTLKRRQAFLRGASSMRKSRSGSKSYWRRFIKGVFESNSWELLSTRRGRAAVIHNFMRGLSLQQTYPLSPFTPLDQRVQEGDEFDGIFEMHPTSVKHIYMVDAGLTFNSPYPLILRPQREVDIILSFDFSARPGDQYQPFKELLLAEKWARLNRLPFPPIDTSVFEKEGMKELYIFRHPTDLHCPIVFHFVLINKTFRQFKKPGVPRETKEELDFADFDVFDDPKAPYSTFNFTYTHRNFERMSQLMEFNTLLHIDQIKEVMREVIKRKRDGPPRVPIQSKDIKLLRLKSVQEVRKLKKFISRMESRSSIYSVSSPTLPFFTPTPNGEVSTNPFFAGFSRDATSLGSSNDGSVFSTPRDRLSESFSRSSRGKKHLAVSDMFRESEELHYLESAQKELGSSSEIFPPTPDSVFGTPPKHHDLLKKYRETAEGTHSQPSSEIQTSEDIVDGPLTEAPMVASSQEQVSSENMNNLCNNRGDTSKEELCQMPLPSSLPSVTPATPPPALSSGKRPMLSPKVKIPVNSFGFPDSSAKFGTNDSGLGSFGVGLDTTVSTTDSLGSNMPDTKTPGTGTFSSDSSSTGSSSASLSGQILSKGRTKKEPPPNPFFAKAHFMRSSHNSSTSSNSSLSSQVGVDSPGNQRVKTLRGSSYRLISPQQSPDVTSTPPPTGRLNSRPLPVSPLVALPDTTSTTPALLTKTSPDTSDTYTLAPEAFKQDGTPVYDSKQAKMFYESVKERRKIMRRQSTISSLNSISLDESEVQDASDENSRELNLTHSVQEEPQKKKTFYSENHFREKFYSVDEDMVDCDDRTTHGEIVSERKNVESMEQRTDYGVEFEIEDLTKFSGVEDSKTFQLNTGRSGSGPSTDVDSVPMESHTKDIWFDAKEDCAV